MKISFILSLLLACILPNPAEPVLCNRLEDSFTGSNYDCRSRPDVSLLDLGGPGCRVSCISKNSTCTQLVQDGGEVCGKFRFRNGFYALGKSVNQFCFIPDGSLGRRFGRYCLTLRVCRARRRLCGCRVIADGRPCLCRIIDDGGRPGIDTRCPLPPLDNSISSSPSFLTALLPSEYEVESEILTHITDAEFADQFDEGYSLFLDYIASLE